MDLVKFDLQMFINIIMLRNYINYGYRLTRLCRFNFNTPFFKKNQSANKVVDEKVGSEKVEGEKFRGEKVGGQRKLFKFFDKTKNETTIKENNSNSEKPKESNPDKEHLQNLVNQINESNKYFLGVKLNTNYLKINKVVKYDEVKSLKSDKANANDIPLQVGKKINDHKFLQSYNKCDQKDALNMKSAQIAFSRSRVGPTLQKISQIIQQFMIKVAKHQRLSNVQPNFELHIIKKLNSLKNKITFNIKNQDALPEIKIKSVTLLKGLAVCRNQNYSTDSFQKNQQQIADGIISYQLYRQRRENYPEIEWFSTKKINARFQVLVKGGPSIEIMDSGSNLGSTQNVIHSVIIETDLVPPPPISQHQLTPQQYLRSYRLDYDSLVITNFDRKNQFYPLTFTEAQKKTVLINGIE